MGFGEYAVGRDATSPPYDLMKMELISRVNQELKRSRICGLCRIDMCMCIIQLDQNLCMIYRTSVFSLKFDYIRYKEDGY